jgi:hypothetical protein
MPLLSGLGALLLAAAPAAEEIRDLAASILRDPTYQATLPRDLVPPHAIDLPWLETLLRVLLWGSLAAIAVLALAWLARHLSGAPADFEVPEPAPAAPGGIATASAEALAAEGRWADAIHALLLETLEALSRAARLAPSLTSREIVERASLPGPARDALTGLVLAVEISRFGGADADENDYRACLRRFQAFLETYRSAA